MNTYQVDINLTGLATPMFVQKMARDISRLTGCKTQSSTLMSYNMIFKIEDCAFNSLQLKNFIKDAYSAWGKIRVSVKTIKH